MDPRYPEQAISRMNELMAQYNQILSVMKTASTSALLAEEERQASLVVQEICLVAPRLHEAMMQASRTRRFTLSHQPIHDGYLSAEEPIQEAVENYVAPNQAETVIVEPKPRKKKTSKKKKAE